MNRGTSLFLIDKNTPDAIILREGESAFEHRTHLTCLLLEVPPTLPFYSYGAMPYGSMSMPDNWMEIVQQAYADQKARVQQIEALLARSGASGDVHSVMSSTLDLKNGVARHARVSDIACVADSLRDAPHIFREAAQGVLFQAPVGLMMNGSPGMRARRVFVAWNSSTAAASAVHAALPFLKEADEVIVACFDPQMTAEEDGEDPGTDLAAWLSHHGCYVTVSQFPSGGHEIGHCIQERAREAGANLVVMGAYGHARMIEAVFGGTTRSMMEQTDLPLLVAH